MVKQPKDKGYNIQDPRDDRDVFMIHETEHTDTRTVGGERVAMKAYGGLKRSSNP